MTDLPTFEDFNWVNENYDGFNPGEAQKRLKTKAAENIRRYRDAQNREDNYAIKKYELMMRLDKLEAESMKVKLELHRLRKKHKK